MFKKICIPIVMLGMALMVQCEKGPWGPEGHDNDRQSVTVKGNGPGGGGNGGNGTGGNKEDQGGSGGIYGDLIICLRDINGMPVYFPMVDDHGDLEYYSRPIMIDAATGEPLIIDGAYQTFALNDEGEPIVEDDDYMVKEVELGRLNLIRSPQSVLDAALEEAINGLTQPGVTSIQTDASGRLIAIIGQEDWLVNFDDDATNDEENDKTIDSPRENMAIYQELLSNGLEGSLSFLKDYFSEEDIPMLSFSTLAAGGDKFGNLLVDEIAYLNNWLLKWDIIPAEQQMGPDDKDRIYYNYGNFSYNRGTVYGNKYLKITVLKSNGEWEDTYQPIVNVVPWTSPSKLIDYSGGANTNISGYARAADDAVQVLEFIHESDLIQYSPYFTATGFVNPN
jgi:hypothetical protein